MDTRKYSVKIGNRVIAVGLRKDQVQAWRLIGQFMMNRVCSKCNRDKGSESMPCPYCNKPSVIKAGKVTVKRYASNTRIGARFDSQSQPGVVYVVRIDKDRRFVSCTCPGWTFRKKCWHKEAYLDKRKKVK